MSAASLELPPSAQQLFAARRRRLMDAYGPGTAIAIPGAKLLARNSDVDHPFRQWSDLYYLTGFAEPDAFLVLIPGRQEGEAILFLRPRDRERETWDGRRVGLERAKSFLGVDQAFDIANLATTLPDLFCQVQQLAAPFGQDPHLDHLLHKCARKHRNQPRLHLDGPDAFAEVAAVLAEQRMFKSGDEIAALRRAGHVTSEAHHEAMRLCQPGVNERELQAAVEYVFLAGGAARVGYGSIVARGDNATILHYHENCEPVRDGDLVLIDAGAEVDYFTADITRTFPANGRFSPEQRAVYDVVLEAQKRAVDACRVGTRFVEVHELALRTLVQGAVDLGLLQGSVDELIEKEGYKRIYMHRTSHWLGMDVHDVGRYHDSLPGGNRSRALLPGMVLTIEPGLYMAPDDLEVPEAFRGIGIRIEDDVLVTPAEPDNLTGQCVKEIPEIEAMVAAEPRWVRRVSL